MKHDYYRGFFCINAIVVPLPGIFFILALIFNLRKWIYFNLSIRAASLLEEKSFDERSDIQKSF